MSTDKLDRLPRWARDEITNSRRKIATLEEALRLGVVGENFPKANLHLTQNQLDWMPSAFHAGRIMMGERWDNFVDFRMDTRSGQPCVYVHSGWSHLVLRPSSGNAVHITTER